MVDTSKTRINGARLGDTHMSNPHPHVPNSGYRAEPAWFPLVLAPERGTEHTSQNPKTPKPQNPLNIQYSAI